MVLVRWVDSSANDVGWIDAQEMLEFATDGGYLAESCGLVVYEDEDFIAIVRSWGGRDFSRQDAGLMIPKVAILELRDLTFRKAAK